VSFFFDVIRNLCNGGVDGKEKPEFMEMTELRDNYEIFG
jgi:hypothetical protein